MPSHNHPASVDTQGQHIHSMTFIRYAGQGYSNNVGWGSDEVSQGSATLNTAQAGSHTHTVNIGNSGGQQAHNNVPPYAVAHIWQRVS